MFDARTRQTVFVFVLTLASSCALLSPMTPVPTLFPEKASVEEFDFERDTLSQPPDGFETRHGRWSVADSPTSLSGTQVLVRGGEDAAVLAVKNSSEVRVAAGEVSVRVFLGSSGAGLGCAGGAGGDGYVVKLEPTAGRVALYRMTGDSLAVAAETPLPTPKGEWARLGIRCEANRVIGYVDGKPLLRDRSTVGSFGLALFADAGVTAQFDDLKYWARK